MYNAIDRLLHLLRRQVSSAPWGFWGLSYSIHVIIHFRLDCYILDRNQIYASQSIRVKGQLVTLNTRRVQKCPLVVQAHIHDSYAWFVRSVWPPFQQVHNVHCSEWPGPWSSDGAHLLLWDLIFYESVAAQLPIYAFRPCRDLMYTDFGCLFFSLHDRHKKLYDTATIIGMKVHLVNQGQRSVGEPFHQ